MGRQKTQVIETRLGQREIDLDKVLYFPRGLIGFENHHEFILLQIKEDSPFLVLQSIDNPKVGLLVADPYSFTKDYEVKIAEAEQRILKLKTMRQVAVLNTVSIPPGDPDKTALNLSGPILINHEARIGLQAPQVDSRYAGRLYLHGPGAAEQAPE